MPAKETPSDTSGREHMAGYFPSDMAERIRAYAAEHKRSASWVIVESVAAFFENIDRKAKR